MIRVLNGSSLENKGQPNEHRPNEVGHGMQQPALRVEGRCPHRRCRSSTLSQGTHHKFRVGSNDDQKRARSGFRLATPRLPMTNCID